MVDIVAEKLADNDRDQAEANVARRQQGGGGEQGGRPCVYMIFEPCKGKSKEAKESKSKVDRSKGLATSVLRRHRRRRSATTTKKTRPAAARVEQGEGLAFPNSVSSRWLEVLSFSFSLPGTHVSHNLHRRAASPL